MAQVIFRELRGVVLEEYEKVKRFLGRYFSNKDWYELFLYGGCYWFANYIKNRVDGSYLMINRQAEHCGVCIGGKLYDITGRISKEGYIVAGEREMSYMKRNYKPDFDIERLETDMRRAFNEG